MFHDELRRLLTRPAQSHKYSFGHVLVVGGAPGTVGAPLLAARAALRSGAGLVTVASETAVIDRLAGLVPEVMTLAIDDSGSLADFIRERKVSVVVVGPGLAVGRPALEILGQVLRLDSVPLVVDGGALSVLAGQTDRLPAAANPAVILTPHRGEFSRLLGATPAADGAGLKSQAATFARQHRVELVLKGHPTCVAHPGGGLYENPTGNPGLATAGSGDVLGGVIAALLAQSLTAAQAAEAGVYLHGLAGDIAAAAYTQPGMTATDVIESIPQAFQRLDSDVAAA